jgi:hypothetical protein
MLKRIMVDALQGVASDDRHVVLRQVQALLHGHLDARRLALDLEPISPERERDTRWGGVCCTYFIRMESPVSPWRRPVKIGRAVEAEARRGGLLTGSPYPLTLLVDLPSRFVPELVAQSHLAQWRLRGEWFEDRDGVRSLVNEIRNFLIVQELRAPRIPRGDTSEPQEAARQ